MFNQLPYMMATPMYGAFPAVGNVASSAAPSALGTLSSGTSLLGKFNWSSLLSNAQKTLNVVNQAIPLYYQVKPVFKNIRTIGKIGREFTKLSSSNNSSTQDIDNLTENVISKNSSNEESSGIPNPTFFL